MKEWTKTIEIDAPIDYVWSFLDGPVENMQRIMPGVLENKPVKVTEEKVGSIYRQKYKEGKRIEEYDIETLEYLNTPDEKNLKVGFTLAKMFEITAKYELRKINDQKTQFTYTTRNKPLKAFLKLFLFFAGDRVVVKFCEKVKKEAEADYKTTSAIR
ncbi:SRPBCC family protein [Cytobacillus gottheilii]|uniref:SRPBCC family protein n=1 Tax=Cytobacillus gottheilii TaxID=859144 RepID=UPI000836BB6A|nr:SRPBCC family protein [Cytobacillus gottheilii]